MLISIKKLMFAIIATYIPLVLTSCEQGSSSASTNSFTDFSTFTNNSTGSTYTTESIIITTQQLQISKQVMQDESFNVIATLSGSYSESATVTLGVYPSSNGITLSNNNCILESGNRQCNFTVVPNWNQAIGGDYILDVTVSSNINIVAHPSSLSFSVSTPGAYLPQTGEKPRYTWL